MPLERKRYKRSKKRYSHNIKNFKRKIKRISIEYFSNSVNEEEFIFSSLSNFKEKSDWKR